MAQLKTLTFVSVWVIVNLRIVLVFDSVAVHVWWLFEQSEGAKLPFHLGILEVPLPAHGFLLRLLEQLVLQVEVIAGELAPP